MKSVRRELWVGKGQQVYGLISDAFKLNCFSESWLNFYLGKLQVIALAARDIEKSIK